MSQLGYFGKIPHRGDFVRFNLPQSFIKVWDEWLQQIMINGEGLGEQWPQLYVSAPSYRFVLSSGIAGSTPWMGVLRTSQDKVGRRFPFTLVMSLPETALPCISAVSNNLFFDEADALLDRVLANDYPFDHLQDELASMAGKFAEIIPESNYLLNVTSKPLADAITVSTSASNALYCSNSIPALLDTVLQQTLGEYSVWLANNSSKATIINSGLPIDSAGLALINSNWRDASTAFLDLTTLPDNMINVETSPISTNTDEATAGTCTASNLSSEESIQIGDADATVKKQKKVVYAVNETINDDTPNESENNPSADDWAALDDLDNSNPPNSPAFIPIAEPLELDDEEDDVDSAPWDK